MKLPAPHVRLYVIEMTLKQRSSQMTLTAFFIDSEDRSRWKFSSGETFSNRCDSTVCPTSPSKKCLHNLHCGFSHKTKHIGSQAPEGELFSAWCFALADIHQEPKEVWRAFFDGHLRPASESELDEVMTTSDTSPASSSKASSLLNGSASDFTCANFSASSSSSKISTIDGCSFASMSAVVGQYCELNNVIPSFNRHTHVCLSSQCHSLAW